MAWSSSIHPRPNSAPSFPVSWDISNHWVQHEASTEVSDQLVKFLRIVKLGQPATEQARGAPFALKTGLRLRKMISHRLLDTCSSYRLCYPLKNGA
jgi:hypothetical protein